jgi:imidazolonepropionase-like amidohydrolase
VMKLLRLAILCAAAAASAVQAGVTLVHAGKLFDADSGRMLTGQTIVIDGDRIKAVEPGYRAAAAGETVIDLKKMTVLPGLIDLHVHLAFESSRDSYHEEVRLDPADYAYRSVRYAERTLRAGFTTVRDLGSDDNVTINLKRAIASGIIVGPRVFTAGKSIGSTGGHADPTNGRNLALRGDPGPREGMINGTADAWKAVRQRYKDGADLIKIMATGGVLSLAASGQNPQLTDAEIAAVVAAAKDYGFKVAVHAHGAEGIKRAVRGGVDTIDHGTYLDDEGMKLMKQKGVWLVPTISAGKFVAEKAKVPGYLPEIVVPKAAAIGPKIQDTVARAWKAGVPMAFGTDSGVSAHGENAKEFGFLAEAGVPANEALRMATVLAAKALGRDDVGALKPGAYADLIAVEADPLADVRALEKVAFVMQGGKPVAR